MTWVGGILLVLFVLVLFASHDEGWHDNGV